MIAEVHRPRPPGARPPSDDASRLRDRRRLRKGASRSVLLLNRREQQTTHVWLVGLRNNLSSPDSGLVRVTGNCHFDMYVQYPVFHPFMGRDVSFTVSGVAREQNVEQIRAENNNKSGLASVKHVT